MLLLRSPTAAEQRVDMLMPGISFVVLLWLSTEVEQTSRQACVENFGYLFVVAAMVDDHSRASEHGPRAWPERSAVVDPYASVYIGHDSWSTIFQTN
jgi:hypothetical protein